MIASVFLRRTERGTITVSEEREGSEERKGKWPGEQIMFPLFEKDVAS